MIALIFAIAQVTLPVLPDNTWHAGDIEYPWPLPAEWSVLYSHGDERVNGTPPPGLVLQWSCFLDEGVRSALCISSWEWRAGTVCHRERQHSAFEHPWAWYERHRGRAQVYLWTYAQRLPQWPEWQYAPVYSWQYDRLQRIPSAPGCLGVNGCSARAHYFIREATSPLFANGVDWIRNGNPGTVVPLSPVAEPAVCRGWLQHADWCGYNPGRPECQTPAQVGA